MEAIHSSETLVNTTSTWCHIPEDCFLQRLAEEWARKDTSDGCKSEAYPKRIQKVGSHSTSSLGFSKCGATEMLEVLPRKVIPERNMCPKQSCMQTDSLPSKKQHESCGRGLEVEERSWSCDINAYTRYNSDDKRFLDQNLSTQHPYLIGAEETPEGPYKVVTQLNDVVYRIQKNPMSRMLVVNLYWLAPYHGAARDEHP
jgi:hypothetical protein